MTEPVKCEEDKLVEWLRAEITRSVAIDKKFLGTASYHPTYRQLKPLKLVALWNPFYN